MGAVLNGFGKFNGDIGGEGSETVEDVDIKNGGVAGGHEHDHRFADGPAEPDHAGGEESAHGSGDDDSNGGLPAGRPSAEGGGAKVARHGGEGVVGDRVDDGDDRETHHETDDQGVTLDVGVDDTAARVKADGVQGD